MVVTQTRAHLNAHVSLLRSRGAGIFMFAKRGLPLTLTELHLSPDNQPSCLRDSERFPIVGEQGTIGEKFATISAR